MSLIPVDTEFKDLPPPRGSSMWGTIFGVPPPVEAALPMYHFRPQSLIQPFRFVERLKMANEYPMLGAVMALSGNDIARLMAGVGYDFIFLDWEHNAWGIREITEAIKTINSSSEGHTGVIVRVPGFHHEYIGWALDAGASGILVPHTETVEQAKSIVKSSRFLKHENGARSFPPFAVFPGINDATPAGQLPFNVWNGAAVILQIESKLGCDNADDLAAVPGVNALMLGMGDLTFDLGLGLEAMGGHPELDACVAKVMAAAKKHNLPVLGWANDISQIKGKIAEGYSIISIESDAASMAKVFRTNLIGARNILKDVTKPEGQ